MAACIPEETLLAFASHALDAARATEVGAHVGVCVACRVVLAEVGRGESSPAAVAGAPLQRGMSLGRYQLGACVGVGGMGAVYEAHDPKLGRRVALKVLHEVRSDGAERAQRFLHERQILAGLDHPHIARLLDGGETEEGRAFLVLEFVEGRPIDQYCDLHRLPTSARLALFRVVCEAVHHAHQSLVVHRDLKPSNILVTAKGVPKLVDFGIAKLLDPGPSATQVTAAGRQPMTPAFASPEQVGQEPVTTATDVYSLGVVLYQLLTGRGPYRLATGEVDELLRAVQAQEPQRPSAAVAGLPLETVQLREASPERLRRRLAGEVDAVVLMALRKAPGDRYASAERFAEDVRCVLEERPTSARRGSALYRATLLVRRHKASAAAASAALLTLLGGAGTTLWQARAAQRARERSAVEALEAARLGAEAAQMQELMRVELLLPAHALPPAYGRIRRLMAPLLAHPATAAPGPAAFTLGRGHQLLGEDSAAFEELSRAWALGFRRPEVARALARTEGRLYARELAVLGRIDDPARKRARLAELARRYREPAAERLRLLGEAGEADRAVMGARLALVEQRFKEAAVLARQAAGAGADPLEAGELEGEAQFLGAAELFERGDPGAGAALTEAAATLEAAAAVGRSAPGPRLLLARVRVVTYDLQSRTAGFRLAALEPIVAGLREAEALDPSAAELHNVWAGVEKRRGDALAAAAGDFVPAYRAAVDHAERAVAASPLDPRIALLQLANTAHALALALADRGGDPLPANAQGLEAAARAQALSPDASGPLFNLTQLRAFRATWLGEHGDDARAAAGEAVADARRFLALGDRPVTARVVLAKALEAAAQTQWLMGGDGEPLLAEGVKALEDAAALTPNNPSVLEKGLSLSVSWATAALAEGRAPEEALRAGRAWADALSPIAGGNVSFAIDVGTFWLVQGRAELFAGRDPSAWLDKAAGSLASGAKAEAPARAALAEVELTRAQWASAQRRDPAPAIGAALAHARAAQQLDPKDAGARLLEGRALLAQPRPSAADLARAQAAVEESLALSPRQGLAWVAQARVREALGDLPGARASLAQASRLQPRLEELARLRAAWGP